MKKDFSRRDFLKGTTAFAATSLLLKSHVLGRDGYLAPNSRLNIAAIGVGGKGASDLWYASKLGKENVVALCDVDLGQISKESRERFPKAAFFQDFRVMFDKVKNIDAVTISAPDHIHAIAAKAAMERGIHVYVQKPLTHNIKEARLLTQLARKYKVVSQMGNQGASSLGMKKCQQWFDKGLIGHVREVHVWTNRPVWPQGIPVPVPSKAKPPKTLNWDLWLGPAPYIPYSEAYHPFNWRGWWAYGTGALGDMGCHLIDVPFRTLGLGYPTAVECSVGSVFRQMWVPEYIPEGCPPASIVHLDFKRTKKNKKDIKLTWYDGGLKPSRPKLIPPDEAMGDLDGQNGVIMIGSRGIMTAGVYGLNPRLYRKNKETLIYKSVEPLEPEHGHQYKWVDACKAGFNSPQHLKLTSSFDYSGPMTETILMGNIAIRSYMLKEKDSFPGRKKLLWNGKEMKIENFEQANQFVSRDYRAGWSL